MHCSPFRGLIQDLGSGRLLAESAPLGHTTPAPLDRSGDLFVRRAPVHYWSWINGGFANNDVYYRIGEGWTDESNTDSDRRCPMDERKDVELEASTGCQASMGVGLDDGETRAYFDGAGHFLAAIRLREGDAARVNVRVDPEAKKLAIEGAGCALAVPFARAP
jgi:hypothetical protein